MESVRTVSLTTAATAAAGSEDATSVLSRCATSNFSVGCCKGILVVALLFEIGSCGDCGEVSETGDEAEMSFDVVSVVVVVVVVESLCGVVDTDKMSMSGSGD
jgi:hypothetical protein